MFLDKGVVFWRQKIKLADGAALELMLPFVWNVWWFGNYYIIFSGIRRKTYEFDYKLIYLFSIVWLINGLLIGNFYIMFSETVCNMNELSTFKLNCLFSVVWSVVSLLGKCAYMGGRRLLHLMLWELVFQAFGTLVICTHNWNQWWQYNGSSCSWNSFYRRA
jgi:hypothetical protein